MRSLVAVIGAPRAGKSALVAELVKELGFGAYVQPQPLSGPPETDWRLLQFGPWGIWVVDTRSGHRGMRGYLGADATILVVDASPGGFEAGMNRFNGQTREALLQAFTFGIKHLFVAVNRCADAARLVEVTEELRRFLRRVGYKVDEVPIVALPDGDDELWQWLRALPPVDRVRDAVGPLRLCVTRHFGAADAGAGVVLGGEVRVGDRVVVGPVGEPAVVESLQRAGTPVTEARAGDVVGVRLSPPRLLLHRGGALVLGPPSDALGAARSARSCKATIILFSGALSVGAVPIMHVGGAAVPVRVAAIRSVHDKRSMHTLEEDARSVRRGQIAKLELEPLKPVVLQAYAKESPVGVQSLGRFVLVVSGRPLAAGRVDAVESRSSYQDFCASRGWELTTFRWPLVLMRSLLAAGRARGAVGGVVADVVGLPSEWVFRHVVRFL